MQIKYSREALKVLEKQTRKSVERIRVGIAKLALEPPEGDIAPLRGYSDGRLRLRIGTWRIIYRYTVEGRFQTLLIISIGNRGDIYK